MFLTKEDLYFLLAQIEIAEQHSTATRAAQLNAFSTTGRPLAPETTAAALRNILGPQFINSPLGLRTVSGVANNLNPNRATYGAADQGFSPSSSLLDSLGAQYPSGTGSPFNGVTNTNYTFGATADNNVVDASPRWISNLISTQNTSNPAAIAAGDSQNTLLASALNPVPFESAALGPDGQVIGRDGQPIITPINGSTTGPQEVGIPNAAPNPIDAPYNSWLTLFGQGFDHGLDFINKGGNGTVFVPLDPSDPLYKVGNPNFIAVTRATRGPGGSTTNATTPFIDMNQAYGSHASTQVFLRAYSGTGTSLRSTGKMLSGASGGLPTWAEVKSMAATVLGIQLTDADVGNVPMIATDDYGEFIPGPNGRPQVVIQGGGLLEGNPASPLSLANAVRTGHAFLLDIAHNSTANPLDKHFVAGDGRVNENQGLTAFHTIFHEEHDRLVDEYKRIAVESGDLNLLNRWLITPLTSMPASVAAVPVGNWDGERLFQAARLVNEMEYQHSVFEEFGRFIDPNIPVNQAYSSTVDPAITKEFAHVVYRFGHSMLNESVDRFGVATDGTWVNNSESLVAAFLDPVGFLQSASGAAIPAKEAAAEVLRGMTRQHGYEIDEFVTPALHDQLLGLPLDLATINLARGRELGIPKLNAARRAYYQATNSTTLAPYASWKSFGGNLRHPESLINFVAAYGDHPSITGATTIEAKRAAAMTLVTGSTSDARAFMFGTGAYAATKGGLEQVDFWIGGLAELPEPGVKMLGSTFAYVFQQQLAMLQEGDRFYYLKRLAGNLLTQIEQNTLSAMAERNLGVSSLPGHIFSLPTWTLEVIQKNQHTLLGSNNKADPAGEVDRVSEGSGVIGYSVDNTLRYLGGGHVVLGGSDQRDLLQAGGENDTLYGRGAADVMFGGTGADRVYGGPGDDHIFDNAGLNLLYGEQGHDVMVGGGDGLSVMFGGPGNDWIHQTRGGNGGAVEGEMDGDFILGSPAGTAATAGAGSDWFEGAILSGADLVNLDEATGVIALLNGAIIRPAVGHDVALSKESNDAINGEFGHDVFIDGSGVDAYTGSQGFDWVSFARNGIGGSGSDASGASLQLGVAAIPNPAVFPDTTDGQVEAVTGSSLADNLNGSDRTDLVSGAAALPITPGLPLPVLAGNMLYDTNLDGVVNSDDGQPVVIRTHRNTAGVVIGGIDQTLQLDDRLFNRSAQDGGIPGLFADVTANGVTFRRLIPAALLDTAYVDLQDDLASPAGVRLTGRFNGEAFYNRGDVVLGGGSTDFLMGRAGDDVVDGDASLNVQLQWTSPIGQVVRFNDMDEINRANLVLGLAIKPNELSIYRELISTPSAGDVAAFVGSRDEYLVEGIRRVYANAQNQPIDGNGVLAATTGDLVDYEELNGVPFNFPELNGVPLATELGVDGLPLAATFLDANGISQPIPRTIFVRDDGGGSFSVISQAQLLTNTPTVNVSPRDVNNDGFISVDHYPTYGQIVDPARLLQLGGVATRQGSDYVRNVENLRFFAPRTLSLLLAPENPADLVSGTLPGSLLPNLTNVAVPATVAQTGGFSASPMNPAGVQFSASALTANAATGMAATAPLPLVSATLASDAGRSATDRITNAPVLTLSGATGGQVYQWSLSPEPNTLAWKTVVGSSLDLSTLSDGPVNVYLRVVEGGSLGPVTSFAFNLDRLQPAVPVQDGFDMELRPRWITEADATLQYSTNNGPWTNWAAWNTNVGDYITRQLDLAGNPSASSAKVSYQMAPVNDGAAQFTMSLGGTAISTLSSPPSIASGSVLSAAVALNDPDNGSTPVAPTYRWEVSLDGSTGWTPVGTNANSYTVKTEDLKKWLRLVVSYTDAQNFSETVTMAPVRLVSDHVNPAAFTVNGTADAQQTLQALKTADDGNGNGVFRYQWELGADSLGSFNPISQETGSTYTVRSSDGGKFVRLTVSYTDAEGFPETVVSAARRINSAQKASFRVDGTGNPGTQLTATKTADDSDGNGTFTYTWQRSDTEGGTYSSIQSGFSNAYMVQLADAGKWLRLQVTYTDTLGFAETFTSAPQQALLLPPGLASDGISVTGSQLSLALTKAMVNNPNLIPTAQDFVVPGFGVNTVTRSADGTSLILGLSAAPASTAALVVTYAGSPVKLEPFTAVPATTFTATTSVTSLAAQYKVLTLGGTAAINGTGNTGANTINGNSAANVLNGGGGADTLKGGLGNDTYVVGNAGVVVQEDVNAGTDLVQAGLTYVLPDNLENLALTGTAALNGTGNALANTLTGNGAINVLVGGAGIDRIIGGNAADQLTGGSEADTFAYVANAESLLAAPDRITDLQVGVDLVDGPRADSTVPYLGTVTALNETGIATLLNSINFDRRTAVVFGFGTQRFLALNDDNRGYTAAQDAVIEITGAIGATFTVGQNTGISVI